MKTRKPIGCPSTVKVWRQSRDYLYGWNWVDETAPDALRPYARGHGYSTRRAAVAAAQEYCARGGARGEQARYLERLSR